VKEKPTVFSTFFGRYPSDHIPKATKDVNKPKLVFFTVGIPVNYSSKYL
jgi:hypothetical protein